LQERTILHVIVDLLDIVGGGMFADALYRKSWIFGVASLIIIGIALWLDRRNALREG
jgi:hypothetical protein